MNNTGGCRVCGKNDHLAFNCPLKRKQSEYIVFIHLQRGNPQHTFNHRILNRRMYSIENHTISILYASERLILFFICEPTAADKFKPKKEKNFEEQEKDATPKTEETTEKPKKKTKSKVVSF